MVGERHRQGYKQTGVRGSSRGMRWSAWPGEATRLGRSKCNSERAGMGRGSLTFCLGTISRRLHNCRDVRPLRVASWETSARTSCQGVQFRREGRDLSGRGVDGKFESRIGSFGTRIASSMGRDLICGQGVVLTPPLLSGTQAGRYKKVVAGGKKPIVHFARMRW